MADQIKELIEKINQEGVAAAQEKARQIEDDARAKAEVILEKADNQAKKTVSEAEEKVLRLEASSRAALQQAARDMLLSLKKDILALLERLMVKDLSAALPAEALSAIIAGIIKQYCAQDSDEVVIYLSGQDKAKLEGHFLGKLKDELKKGIQLRQDSDIQAGFIISFDSGKSHFDFSDQVLAKYLGVNLKPKVAELFKDIK
jgi:V/A-type H+/Na+-transporting ATPase subunit E